MGYYTLIDMPIRNHTYKLQTGASERAQAPRDRLRVMGEGRPHRRRVVRKFCRNRLLCVFTGRSARLKKSRHTR